MKIPQSIPVCRRFTINDFNTLFTDDSACLNWLMEQRYPGGIAMCSYCKVVRKHHRIASKKAFACDYCGTYVSPMAGTIFEKSSTSLRLWFYAMYLMGSTRCGISAKQIQRECGVTYKTAWRMFKQIRSLMSDDTPLSGPKIEMDETYVGGKGENKHFDKRAGRGRSWPPKASVFGMVERGGEVRAYVTPDVKAATLLGIVKDKVLDKSTVFTDDFGAYDNLGWMGKNLTHKRIQHSQKVYVVGQIHTNTIEGFWSLLKRGIAGVYHSVSAKYLQSYCDEYAFRYNRRAAGEPMFTSLLSQVVAKAE
jgi:transposase